MEKENEIVYGLNIMTNEVIDMNTGETVDEREMSEEAKERMRLLMEELGL